MPDGTASNGVTEDAGDDRINEAFVLAFARKLERNAQKSRDLPKSWLQPMFLARPLLDALGAISIGFLAANVSILLIFIVVNVLLHM